MFHTRSQMHCTDPNLPLEGMVSRFKALSDPLRLQILVTLYQQELCVCDLCDRLQVAQSKLSFHLKVLKEADLLLARQQGKWTYYQINQPQLEALEQHLTQLRSVAPVRPSRICSDS